MEITTNLSGFLLYILISLVIGRLLYGKWKNRHLNRFFGNFSGGQRISTLEFCKILKFKNNMIHFLTNFYEEYACSTIFGWMGPKPLIVTTDVDFIQKICTSPELQIKSTIYNPITERLKGLPFISGKKWQHHRRMLNPSFHNSLLLKFVDNFNKAKDDSILEFSKMADGSAHELSHMMIYITMKTTLEASFGSDLPREEVDELTKGVTSVIKEGMWHLILAFMNLSILSKLDRITEKTLEGLKLKMRKLFDDKLRASEMAPKQDGLVSDDAIRKNPKTLINQSIELYQRKEFTMDEVLSELLVSLAASFDTTGITMYSVLLMLAMHPEVQERVFEEVATVFPDRNFKMEYHHIAELQYFDMVVKETMRLFPAIVQIGRDVPTDTALTKDVILPGGLQILISIFHLHRRKDIWGEDANDFNPDHFLPENVANLHPYAFIPFSKGARNCIGWRYAEILIRVVLPALIRNFRFETDAKYQELELESSITIEYKNPPMLRIYARE